MTINSQTVSSEVHDVAQNVRQLISEKLKNKLVCLKFDSATRHERRILGLVCQTITNGKIEIFTLSMLEVKNRQTIGNLKEHILEVLKTYNINTTNIYACTVDNGKNMLGCVRKLSVEQAVELESITLL